MTATVKRVLRRIEAGIRKLLYSPAAWLSKQVLSSQKKLSRLGTEYGGWTVVQESSLHNSWAILCGAGEDISFDLALQTVYKCNVLIADPTPQAVAHFALVSSSACSGKRVAINNSTSEFYDLANVDFSMVHYTPVAVWTKKTTIKFWLPLERSNVSHSITNLQNTDEYIEVAAEPLSHMLKKFAVSEEAVQLVKLDIEGAEVDVIDWMCDNSFLPKQVLVEFDEMTFPDRTTLHRVKHANNRLKNAGYELAYFDGRSNCTYLRMK